MRDVLPPETARLRALVGAYRAVFEAAGYAEVRTPVLEELAVFLRVGEGTDVVSKEMYTFTDRDGTEVALRPETTASVARAFLQHHPIVPWKVWYVSDHFRHERPQKGRLRQHSQFGVEVIGSADPDVDVEVIVGLWDAFASIGLRRNRLLLNSIGEPATRAQFGVVLGDWLRARLDELDPADRDHVDANPMRVLDSKLAATVSATDGHPTLLEVMSDAERTRFERVQSGIEAAGVPFEVEPRLVRGLDYYTHTVFEIVSDAIDASQSTIGGGGRYDGLVEAHGRRSDARHRLRIGARARAVGLRRRGRVPGARSRRSTASWSRSAVTAPTPATSASSSAERASPPIVATTAGRRSRR